MAPNPAGVAARWWRLDVLTATGSGTSCRTVLCTANNAAGNCHNCGSPTPTSACDISLTSLDGPATCNGAGFDPTANIYYDSNAPATPDVECYECPGLFAAGGPTVGTCDPHHRGHVRPRERQAEWCGLRAALRRRQTVGGYAEGQTGKCMVPTGDTSSQCCPIPSC